MHYIGTEITNTTINIYNMYKTSERGYKSYKPGVQTLVFIFFIKEQSFFRTGFLVLDISSENLTVFCRFVKYSVKNSLRFWWKKLHSNIKWYSSPICRLLHRLQKRFSLITFCHLPVSIGNLVLVVWNRQKTIASLKSKILKYSSISSFS